MELWSFLCGLTEVAYGFRSWAKQLPAPGKVQTKGQPRADKVTAASAPTAGASNGDMPLKEQRPHGDIQLNEQQPTTTLEYDKGYGEGQERGCARKTDGKHCGEEVGSAMGHQPGGPIKATSGPAMGAALAVEAGCGMTAPGCSGCQALGNDSEDGRPRKRQAV